MNNMGVGEVREGGTARGGRPRSPAGPPQAVFRCQMRRWLWDTADELLAAWNPPGTERAWTDAEGRPWTERGSRPDLEHYHRGYDQLLWEIVTSPCEELARFAAVFFHEP